MRNTKIAVVVLFILTIIVGAAAIFIGKKLTEEETVAPEVTEAAAEPEGCKNPTAENPENDPNCGGTPCLTYCPAWNGPAVLVITIEGDIIRIYQYYTADPSLWSGTMTVNGKEQDLCLTCDFVDYKFDSKQTDISIDIEYTEIKTGKSDKPMGWRSPANGECGDLDYKKPPITKIPTLDDDFEEVSVQCWGDQPQTKETEGGKSGEDFDFNDFMFRVAIGNQEVSTTTTTKQTTSATTAPSTSISTTTRATTIPGQTSVPTTVASTSIPTTSAPTTVKYTTLPPTGLLDNASGNALAGLTLITSGFFILFFATKFNLLTLSSIHDQVETHSKKIRNKNLEKRFKD